MWQIRNFQIGYDPNYDIPNYDILKLSTEIIPKVMSFKKSHFLSHLWAKLANFSNPWQLGMKIFSYPWQLDEQRVAYGRCNCRTRISSNLIPNNFIFLSPLLHLKYLSTLSLSLLHHQHHPMLRYVNASARIKIHQWYDV